MVFSQEEKRESNSRRLQREQTDKDLKKKAGYSPAPQKVLGSKIVGSSTHNQSIARQYTTYDPRRERQEVKEVSHVQPH